MASESKRFYLNQVGDLVVNFASKEKIYKILNCCKFQMGLPHNVSHTHNLMYLLKPASKSPCTFESYFDTQKSDFYQIQEIIDRPFKVK